MTINDVFRPHTEPARAIYDAFQLEASRRAGRSFATWSRAEIDAVHWAACFAAELPGLRAPTMEEVEAAEAYARGSIDYGSKWAYQVVAAMRRPCVDAR